MAVKKVVVTGGSGLIGSRLIPSLIEAGCEVINLDLRLSESARTYPTDLCNFDSLRTLFDEKIFSHVDAVIHLAGIPNLREETIKRVFAVNAVSAFNLLEVALARDIKKVVMASSEAVLGFSYKYSPISPQYLPIDEEHALLAQDAYGLSKITLEQIGTTFSRRYLDASITSLRFSMILQPDTYKDRLPRMWADNDYAASKLFSYVDVRDAVKAIKLAAAHRIEGHTKLFISASNTFMKQTTGELVSKYFPGVKKLKTDSGNHHSLINTSLAKKSIGFYPEHSWRDHFQ